MKRWPEVVFGVAILLLLPLGYLQWRWVSRLAEAERQGLERQLLGAATNVAREFDLELTRTTALLVGWRQPPSSAADPLAQAKDRFDDWTEQAHDPRLLSSFWVVVPDSGQWRLHRWNAATATFDPLPWPASLASFRDHIENGLPAFPPRVLVSESELFLLSPRFRPANPPRLESWIIIGLDTAFLRRDVLPQLLAQHLGADFAQRYRVEVRSTATPLVRLFGEEVSSPDVTVGLLAFRGGPFARGGPPVRSVFRDPSRPKGPRHANAPAHPAPFDELRPPLDQPRPAFGAPPPSFPPAPCELRLQHRAGSIAQFVQHTRRWNLAVSAGALAALALSLAFLVLAARRARQFAQLQMDFVAGVSHELRTPLSVICSAGENLADGVASQPAHVQRYGALIRDEGRRLSQLVEQVLSFARLQTSHHVLRDSLPVRELLDEAVASSQAELAAAQASVRISDSLSARVRGDRVALIHCFHNLLANAARHGKPGGVIRIDAAPRGAFVEVTIDDDGPGFSSHDLAHLFQPFYRGERARQSHSRGLGLGLTLVRRIVEAHGGHVTAENLPQGGARFRLRLPRDSQ